MTAFKVALVALDGHEVPGWVYDRFERERVQLASDFSRSASTAPRTVGKSAKILNRLAHIGARFFKLHRRFVISIALQEYEGANAVRAQSPLERRAK